MKKTHWLDLTERALLVGTGIGAAASALSQQLLYTLTPLSLLVALGLLNRHRAEQRILSQTVNVLEASSQYVVQELDAMQQQVSDVPTAETFAYFQQSFLQKSQETFAKFAEESSLLHQQVNHRLKLLEDLDISHIQHRITQLQDQYSQIHESISKVTTYLHRLPSLTRVESSETAIANLKMEMMQIRVSLENISHEARSNISPLQDQIDALILQVRRFSLSADESPLKQEVGELIKAVTELVPKRDFVPLAAALQDLQEQHQVLKQAVSNLETALPALQAFDTTALQSDAQRQVEAALQQDFQQLQADLITLKQQIEAWPSNAAVQDFLHQANQPVLLPLDMAAIQQQLQALASRLDQTEADLSQAKQQLPGLWGNGGSGSAAAPLKLSSHHELILDFPVSAAHQPSHTSQRLLETVLQQTQKRLILIWPWSTENEPLGDELIEQFRTLLQHKVRLGIGWCHRGNRREGRFLRPISQRWSAEPTYRQSLQDTLNKLLPLKQDYPDSFKFKILGTDEHFLVCDRRFAILGLQSLMTANSVFPTLDLKLRTTEPRVIQGLTDRFNHPQIDPHNAAAYFNRGTTRYDLGDYSGALEDYTQVIHLVPNDAVAYNNRGLVHYDLGNLMGAIADFTQAIQLDPRQLAPYCNRGLILAEAGDLLAAIADFNTALSVHTDSAAAYFYRGTVRQKQGNWRTALADFDRAIELSPIAPIVYCHRSTLHQKLGRQQDAIADMEVAVEQFAAQDNFADAQRVHQVLSRLRNGNEPLNTGMVLDDIWQPLMTKMAARE